MSSALEMSFSRDRTFIAKAMAVARIQGARVIRAFSFNAVYAANVSIRSCFDKTLAVRVGRVARWQLTYNGYVRQQRSIAGCVRSIGG